MRLSLLAAAALLAASPVAAQATPSARPGDWGAYLAARQAAVRLDTAAAADFMARALAADPDSPELVAGAMLAALADGRDLQAVQLARRQAATGQPSLAASLILLAEEVRSGRFTEAGRRAAALPRQSAGPILSPVLAAWAAAGEGDPARGFEILQPLAEGARLKGFYAINAALLADRAGRHDEAAQLVAAARQEQLPGILVLRLAEIAAGRGDPADAGGIEAELGEGADDSGIVQGRLAGAPPPVPDAAAGIAETFFMLAALVRAQDSAEFTLLLTRLALMVRPSHAGALLLLADALDTDDRHEAAAAALGHIRESDPLWPLARLRAALLMDRAGATDQALDTLRKLAEALPERPQPWARMGDILRGRKRYAEAADAYTQALARLPQPRAPRTWAVLFARAMALERTQQWDRAEADLKAALALAPDQPYVLNYLAYTWVDRGEHLDQGKAMLERAVELAPNDGQIIDSLGWALFRLGDFPGAVARLERAVELAAADPVINDHLGDAYWRVGRRAEARFQWQRALAAKPEPELAGAIEKKLAEGLPDLPATPSATR